MHIGFESQRSQYQSQFPGSGYHYHFITVHNDFNTVASHRMHYRMLNHMSYYSISKLREFFEIGISYSRIIEEHILYMKNNV